MRTTSGKHDYISSLVEQKAKLFELPEHTEDEKELKRLVELKAYFAEMAFSPVPSHYGALKLKPTNQKVFFERLKPKPIRQFLVNIVKSILF